MVGSLTSTTRRPTPRLARCAPTVDRVPAPTRMGYERGPRLTGISIMTGALRPRLPAFEVFQVPLMVAADLLHAVAAELLEEGFREHDRHHGLPDHAGGGDRADVTPLHHRLDGLACIEVHRPERFAQGRDRLHGGPHDHRLAVGDAPFEPAGTVGAAVEAAVLVEENLVVDLRAGPPGRLEAHADLRALDRVDGAEGPRQETVQLPVPLHVGAKAYRAAHGHALEDATQRVPGRLGPIDGFDHRGLGFGIGAANLAGLRASPDLLPRDLERPDVHAADLGHVAQDRDAEFAKQPLGNRRDRDPGGRLARAGALEHVPDVVVSVFHGAGQVGMAGAGAGHSFRG